MLARTGLAAVLLLGTTINVWAQAPAAPSTGFRSIQDNIKSAIGTATGGSVTRVTSGDGELPRTHGQVWRQYDIRPYTSRVTTTNKPEQAIVDWILRETGVEVWFSEPLGFMSANRDTLRVYHTPDMQRIVSGIVDRFVGSQAERYVYSMHLMTISSPNWRTTSQRLMRPIGVQTPGIEAWLVSRENAALLMGQLKKRTDFRQHTTPEVVVHNGQPQTVSRTRPRNYVRGIRPRNAQLPVPELDMTQINEGFSLELSPLVSLDGRTVDAVIHCQVEQLEKFVSLPLDVATVTGQRQRVQALVPQRSSWRVRERFRWPVDSALLISCGVVASPSAEKVGPLGFRSPLSVGPPRAETLLLIQCNGKASQTLVDLKRTTGAGVAGATGPRRR